MVKIEVLMVLVVVVEVTNQSVAYNTANYVEKRRSRLESSLHSSSFDFGFRLHHISLISMIYLHSSLIILVFTHDFGARSGTRTF